MLRLLFILMLSSLFLLSCASSTPDEDGSEAMSEDDARQKELDEIEALLGVEKQANDKKKSSKDEDTLGLLSSEDVPVKGQSKGTQQQPPPPPPQRTEELESQLAQKDALIADLKRQVKNQNMQISQLEASQSSRPATVYTGTPGDISAGEYEQRYQEGLSMFHSREYQAAIDMFEALLASSSSHNLSDNAQYWIGESHYAQGKYKSAVIDFEKVFTFPQSNKNPDAQFKLGLCYMRLGQSDKAREEFQRLLDVYPESEYVSRAKQHLSEL